MALARPRPARHSSLTGSVGRMTVARTNNRVAAFRLRPSGGMPPPHSFATMRHSCTSTSPFLHGQARARRSPCTAFPCRHSCDPFRGSICSSRGLCLLRVPSCGGWRRCMVLKRARAFGRARPRRASMARALPPAAHRPSHDCLKLVLSCSHGTRTRAHGADVWRNRHLCGRTGPRGAVTTSVLGRCGRQDKQ